MRRIQRSRGLAAAGLILLLTNGCGPDEAPPDGSPPDSGAITLEESPDQVAPREPEASPSEQCIEMATREDWSAALDPCTRAARDHPEDETIQQFLERAIEASDQPLE